MTRFEDEIGQIFYGKTDVKSPFRIVPSRPEQYCFLVTKTQHPDTLRPEPCITPLTNACLWGLASAA